MTHQSRSRALIQRLQGMMGGGMGPGMGAANAVQAQLNEEDEEAIQRLMALGFPRGVVIQVSLVAIRLSNSVSSHFVSL